MRPRIRSPKEFGAGLIHLTFGAAAVWIGRDYAFGTGARMGPGFFPTVLGAALVAIGLASLVRSFMIRGEPIGRIAWKPLFLVVAASLLFGFLLPRAGLAVALAILALLSAAASEKFHLDWRAAAGLAALIAVCVLVFVKGLGVPLPLLGSWFGE